jgi:protein gp37
MNRTRIEWCDFTWNPITGCRHGCDYCYARRIAHRFFPKTVGFNPYFWRDRLQEPLALKKPARIFVCSMADLFGDWVTREWIEAVFETVKACPRHTFHFLTKNPKRLADFNPWPPNAWAGATATDQGMMDEAVERLHLVEGARTYISCEPLLAPVILPENAGIDWLLIGALTGAKKSQPPHSWVESLVESAKDQNVPVFVKNNLKGFQLQEWPA